MSKTTTLYANWKDVPNTLSITLKKDDEIWAGQKIELYANLEKAYELDNTNQDVKNALRNIYYMLGNEYKLNAIENQ